MIPKQFKIYQFGYINNSHFMKNSNSFPILFWTNKAKAGTNGLVPLYARVTAQGKRVEISLRKKTNPKNWDAKSGFMKGGGEEARNINKYFIEVNNDIFAIYLDFKKQRQL
jgi:Arm DNA-binding domain